MTIDVAIVAADDPARAREHGKADVVCGRGHDMSFRIQHLCSHNPGILPRMLNTGSVNKIQYNTIQYNTIKYTFYVLKYVYYLYFNH